MPYRSLISAAALLAVLGLGACGDDDPQVSEAGGPTVPAGMSSDPGGDVDAGPATVTVEIGEFVFDPTPVEIHVGDVVVWHNAHDQAHTSTGNGDQTWNTANIAPDATSDPVPFDEEGTFTYVCALHPFMEGTVEVSA